MTLKGSWSRYSRGLAKSRLTIYGSSRPPPKQQKSMTSMTESNVTRSGQRDRTFHHCIGLIVPGLIETIVDLDGIV